MEKIREYVLKQFLDQQGQRKTNQALKKTNSLIGTIVENDDEEDSLDDDLQEDHYDEM